MGRGWVVVTAVSTHAVDTAVPDLIVVVDAGVPVPLWAVTVGTTVPGGWVRDR